MALTYGFYNSVNKDRLYNATQFSQIFDGVINDGVYMSIGKKFMVRAAGGMGIFVGDGRAWFNHTWTYNDTDMYITLDDSDYGADRIDAIVLTVDARDQSRSNRIEVIKGTPAVSPVKPDIVDGVSTFYHPLAFVTIRGGVTEITDANIENAVGVNAKTPFVTGIIETIDATELITQWGTEWNEWNDEHRQAYLDWIAQQEQDMADWTAGQESDMETWTATQKTAYLDWISEQETAFETWATTYETTQEAAMAEWTSTQQGLFLAWFDRMKDQLSEDAAGHLQLEIDELNEEIFKAVHDICNKNTHIDYVNGDISQITSTNSDFSAVSVTTFEDTEVGKIITTVVTKDGYDYTQTVVINNVTHDITESYTKEEST